MKITEITVHASRTLPHPIQNYANIRPGVTLKASLDEGDNSSLAVQQLQRQAEILVEEHAVKLRSAIEERDVLEREVKEIKTLTDGIHRNTQRLDELKSKHEADNQPEWLSWEGHDE